MLSRQNMRPFATVGTDAGTITETLGSLLTDPELHRRMARAPSPFGDGHAAERVVDAIEAMLRSRRTDENTGWPAAAAVAR